MYYNIYNIKMLATLLWKIEIIKSSFFFQQKFIKIHSYENFSQSVSTLKKKADLQVSLQLNIKFTFSCRCMYVYTKTAHTHTHRQIHTHSYTHTDRQTDRHTLTHLRSVSGARSWHPAVLFSS